ncbi:amino acid ABC transporter substrate-binding protein [Cytobacillus sp. Hz8]|uniref:amino acid ABC transporter substrate-binding protein n=1 Tax=Cytobacillus sp. Hz8 TaxID=3347168 RepID=UPI0035DC5088
MKKLSLFFVLLLSFTLVLAACGTNDDKDTADKAEKKTESNGDLLAKIKDEGKILIGTEGTYPPFTYHDDNGKLTGFDVDIANEVAKRLGVKPEYKETQWDAMFAGLDAKRFDMIVNEVGIRPDRQEKYDFSTPYITSKAVLITNKSNKDIKSFDDLKGKKSAQSLTSNYGDMAKSFGAELVGVEGFNQAVELLSSNRVEATINDNLTYLDYKKKKPDAPIKEVAIHKDASQSGIMFRKGSDTLVAAVNDALADMIDDGTYLKISKKWFGEDVLK